MKFLHPLLLVFFLPMSVKAAPVEVGMVKLRDGRQLEAVRVMKVEPDGLRVEHRDGVGKLSMEDLPADLARRFSLDEATATAWRMEQKKRQDDLDSARLRIKVRAMMEASRAEQESQAGSQRISLFDQAKAGDVNYASLDEQLLDQIQLWKEAGRDDLAARFEADRALLRQQEIARPAATAEAERQALARQVQALQGEVDAAAQRPVTTTVMLDSDLSSRRLYNPYYSSFNPSPFYPVSPPCTVPGPVIIHQPPYCPPVCRPTPIVRPISAVPAPPRPVNTGNLIHGAHLYKK